MKDITIVVIDFLYHDLVKSSIEQTLQHIDAKEILIFSDREIISGAKHIIQSPIITRHEYNQFMLTGVAEYVNTEHALFIQWDGMACNRSVWDDIFLDYDYIGAPWSWETPDRAVGNGGFSLRSKRLLEACLDQDIQPSSSQNEDELIGKVYRGLLEKKYHLRFPTTELARQFSVEERIDMHIPSFGFHGIWNVFDFLDTQTCEIYAKNMNCLDWNQQKWFLVLSTLLQVGKRDLYEFVFARLSSLDHALSDSVREQLIRDQYIKM